MKQNDTKNRPFDWTPSRKTALQLLVEDRLTDEEIARQVGVCRRTLGYWKTHPAFIAAAERMINEYAAKLQAQHWRDTLRRYGL